MCSTSKDSGRATRTRSRSSRPSRAGAVTDTLAELRKLYEEPVKPALVKERLQELRAAGARAIGSLTPQRTVELADQVLAAEPDLFVIQGTVVSAEHVARGSEPLNLKRFVRQLEVPVIVGGCTSYQTALHLMRTGAAGVMVGVGTGETSTCAQRPRSRVSPRRRPSPKRGPPGCATSTRPGCTATSSPAGR